MQEFLLFLGKSVVVFIVIAGVILVIAAAIMKAKKQKSEIEVEKLNDTFKDYEHEIKNHLLSDDEIKEELKKQKKEEKLKKKNPPAKSEKNIYVLNFDGDVKASAVDSLREEITALLQVATNKDEVVVKIESPGGMVTTYGLAASQLMRIRQKNISLTVCVDTVAASGGYLMACVANKILAAPFAVVGSIGVVAQVPNLHKLLKKYDVDYKEYTAGEFKRTVSFLGEITPDGETHFKQKLTDTHLLFKDFVSQNRPQIKLDEVANGDHWYGAEAVKLGLVDKIQTSDEYLLENKELPIFKITYTVKEKFSEKISKFLASTIEKTVEKTAIRFSTEQQKKNL